MVHQFLSQDGFKGTKLNAASKGSDLKVSNKIKVYGVFPVGCNVDIQPCCEHTDRGQQTINYCCPKINLLLNFQKNNRVVGLIARRSFVII